MPLSPKSLRFVGECRMNGVHVDQDHLQDGVQDCRSLRDLDRADGVYYSSQCFKLFFSSLEVRY